MQCLTVTAVQRERDSQFFSVITAELEPVRAPSFTKGAERISEVSARFTLDAMPGKQMAIDADLNAGLINQAQAQTRRKDVASEADFYGAMDGASKTDAVRL